MMERVLALETSSTRGSVALVEGSHFEDASVASFRVHNVANEHAERLLGLIDEALSEARWEKDSLTRIAVGVGPGSFTGVRVGLSIAEGLMLGLGIPGVGIGSLAAVAAGLGREDARLRVVVRDARRDEYFVAAYSKGGEEIVAPHAISQAEAADTLKAKFDGSEYVVLGTAISGLPCFSDKLTSEPDARPLGALSLNVSPEHTAVMPQYVRGPNVVKPNLPPSPLDKPRR